MAATSRKTRVDDAHTQLKREILSNRMQPGFQATEQEIALRLGMSRTPVREALIRLEAEGLIELVPRHGARVLPIRAQDMREIYEILTSLESDAAASLACRKPSAKELAPLTKATQDMEAAVAAEDRDAWAEADLRFHRRLLELHGNRRLKEIVQALSDQAHRARIATLRLRDLPKRSTIEHRRILESLETGDSEGARKVFREHRARAATELVSLLEKLPQL